MKVPSAAVYGPRQEGRAPYGSQSCDRLRIAFHIACEETRADLRARGYVSLRGSAYWSREALGVRLFRRSAVFVGTARALTVKGNTNQNVEVWIPEAVLELLHARVHRNPRSEFLRHEVDSRVFRALVRRALEDPEWAAAVVSAKRLGGEYGLGDFAMAALGRT